jgi:hypothetical protein
MLQTEGIIVRKLFFCQGPNFFITRSKNSEVQKIWKLPIDIELILTLLLFIYNILNILYKDKIINSLFFINYY